MPDETDTNPVATRLHVAVLKAVATGKRTLTPGAAGIIAGAIGDLAAERDALRQRLERAEDEKKALKTSLRSTHEAALMVARDLDRSTGCAMENANAGSLRNAVNDTSIPALASADEGEES